MAKIYPSRPPQSIIDDPLRSAEMKVFSALQTLPDSYSIFYSLHWQEPGNGFGFNEGEADFVIVHPSKGILVLEVKGGGIIFNPSKGKWFSQNRHGELFAIKDPVEQGRRNHYEIQKNLEHLPGWTFEKINIGHAVSFPDVFLKPGQFLKLDLPREIVIDAKDLDAISSSIETVFEYCFGEKYANGAPGNLRMQQIEGLLANSFELRTPLGIELDKEDEKLVELTEQQFRAMALLADRKRVAIAGCAGSGKTMLAARKAQQFFDLGMNVLLVCFNVALSEDLKKRLPNIEVYNFHDLCKRAAHEVGYSLSAINENDDLYNVTLPNALMEAADSIGRVYDAIIVDEGQDFQENYWIALEPLLKEDGYLYIFYDNNQNLYGGTVAFGGLITEQAFPLYQNCRNTKHIHELVAKFHNNPISLVCYGPEGRDPEVIHYSGDDDQMRKLQKLVHKLVVEEHVDNSDIAILTPRGENSTKLTPGTKLGIFTLTGQIPNHQSKIQATSVYKFKGLERKVIILTEIDNRTNFNREMVMYVGCSRARTQLYILSDENAPHQINEKVNSHT